MFSEQIAAKQIELQVEIAPELPPALEADSGKLRQVLINLLSNATKFSERGRISVRARCREREAERCRIEIEVQDDGAGIERDSLARIFDAFDQSQAGVRSGGTGLGLTISRSFARLMSGDLTVQSELGVGSTFTFSFTARVARALPAERGVDARVILRVPEQRRPLRVLVVDDERVNAELMQDLLSSLDFEVLVVGDGEAALAAHTRWAPQLVLMDLRMQGMDGFETTRRLRASGSRAVIIAFTASVLTEAEQEARQAGADDFLRKPYRESELLIKIARALDLPYQLELAEQTAAPITKPEPLSELKHLLPRELIAELREAVVQARKERIERLAERAERYSQPAASQIRALARQFQYELLLAALDPS